MTIKLISIKKFHDFQKNVLQNSVPYILSQQNNDEAHHLEYVTRQYLMVLGALKTENFKYY